MGVFGKKSSTSPQDVEAGQDQERADLMVFIQQLREREQILLRQLAKEEQRSLAMSKRRRRKNQEVELLEEIVTLLNRLDAAVVVRDPGSARSAEAFDGLRRTIIAGAKARRAHVSHLLSLRDSISNGATNEALESRVNDFIEELGLFTVAETENSEWFEIVEGEGDHIECLEPAIVDETELGRVLIRPGKARRITRHDTQEAISGESHDETSFESETIEKSADSGDAPHKVSGPADDEDTNTHAEMTESSNDPTLDEKESEGDER